MIVKFHLWHKDSHETEFEKEVDYIPDQILYNDIWWKKETAVIDFDTGVYSKVHYNEYKR